MITVHVVLSKSPLHVPSKFRFENATEARQFGQAVCRAINVYQSYATDEEGRLLSGHTLIGLRTKAEL